MSKDRENSLVESIYIYNNIQSQPVIEMFTIIDTLHCTASIQ